jgi:hypothetical protein
MCLTAEAGFRRHRALAWVYIAKAWAAAAGEIVSILDERIAQSSGRRRQTVHTEAPLANRSTTASCAVAGFRVELLLCQLLKTPVIHCGSFTAAVPCACVGPVLGDAARQPRAAGNVEPSGPCMRRLRVRMLPSRQYIGKRASIVLCWQP